MKQSAPQSGASFGKANLSDCSERRGFFLREHGIVSCAFGREKRKESAISIDDNSQGTSTCGPKYPRVDTLKVQMSTGVCQRAD